MVVIEGKSRFRQSEYRNISQAPCYPYYKGCSPWCMPFLGIFSYLGSHMYLHETCVLMRPALEWALR